MRIRRVVLGHVVGSLASATSFVFLLGLSNTQPTLAATISFNPSLGVYQSYTSNVLFTSTDEISDTYTTVALTFPVIRTTKKSETRFIYSPAYQFYNSDDRLDNLSHRLELSLGSAPGRTATVNLNLLYYYGQDQGAADSTDGSDIILLPRNTREQGTIGLSFGNRISGRWGWGASAEYETLSYSQIGEDRGDLGPVLPQDRTSIGAAGSITYDLSSLSSAGFEVEVRQFDIDITGKEDVEGLSFVYQKSGSRNSTFNLSVGGYRSTLDPAVPLPSETNLTQTGAQGRFSYGRELRTFGFGIRGSHRPTFGYGRFGTSTDTYLGVIFSKVFSRTLKGGLALSWARSEPRIEFETLDSVDSAAIGGHLSLQAHPTLRLRLSANVVDQLSRANQGGDLPTGDVAVLQATFLLAWSPLAEKPIAQGPSTSGGR
ncbi:MAG: hypothetical protein WBQ27_03130 [Thermoanaerobaculia bacterium]